MKNTGEEQKIRGQDTNQLKKVKVICNMKKREVCQGGEGQEKKIFK